MKRYAWFIVVAILVLVLLLAGCAGQTTTTASDTTLSPPATTPPTTTPPATTPLATAPALPTNLVVTRGEGRASLDWDNNKEANLAGYNVYRSTTLDGPYTQVNTSLVTVSAYTDTGLVGGVIYYYVVTAVDTKGNESVFPGGAACCD